MRKKKRFIVTDAIMLAVFTIPVIAMASYIDTFKEMWMYGLLTGLIIASAEISLALLAIAWL